MTDWRRWSFDEDRATVTALPEIQRGDSLAWTTTILMAGKRITTGHSEVHRALDARRTFCLKPIPADAERFVPDDLHRGLDSCYRCKQYYALDWTDTQIIGDLALSAKALQGVA